MDYLAIRHLHMTFAAVSIALFAVRGAMALSGSDWRRFRPLRWLPHLNDTLLLAAGVSLAAMSHQIPFQQGWLTAKVLALIAYVLLGHRALQRDVPAAQRAPWVIAAMACVTYIVAVAVTRSATLGLI